MKINSIKSKGKVCPLGMFQRDPSLFSIQIRALLSSRQPRPMSAAREKRGVSRKDRGMGEGGGGWMSPRNLDIIPTAPLLPSMWSPHTSLSEFQTAFQGWEDLGFTNTQKEIFCSSSSNSSSSIEQPHRNLGPRVLTDTENPRPSSVLG